MNFTFENAAAFENGLTVLAARKHITLGKGGVSVKAVSSDKPTLAVSLHAGKAEIHYQKPCQFFRGFGLLAEAVEDGKTDVEITERPQFDMNGVMFDMSQGNAAFTVATMKDVLEQFALMGLDTAMLYVEDNYEVENQPYFGYMRPRYTKAEMKELDDYAFDLGIEMIPCIQTLAHLPDVLRWRVYGDIKDYDACLLVGEEKTYAFLEDVIRSAVAPFRTKKIHIGMDEAWELGSGNYLRKNGFKPQGELMAEHLKRVMAIIKKYGLEPMMWDDMFFQSAFGLGGYRTVGKEIPKSVIDSVPEGMDCIYWDYTASSDARFEMQKKLTDRIVFAGGSWAWLGYGLAYTHTKNATNGALALARKYGVRKVFMTTWGDNGAEAPQTFNLAGAQMFAENGYAETFDEEKFARRFKFCTDCEASDFEALDGVDLTPDYDLPADRLGWACASKYLTWQDILTGLIDKNIEGAPLNAHYAKLAPVYAAAAKRNPSFAGEFTMMEKLCDVLSVKSELGLKLTAAYKNGDKAELKNIAEKVLPDLAVRVKALQEIHRAVWFKLYKPFGWDVMDLRYGGLLARMESARLQVKDYLAGKTAKIEELEAERLDFNGEKGALLWFDFYGKIVSPSRIDPMA